MNWLQFTVSMTSALAWPGTVIVVMFVFRKAILERISSLRKLKWKDLELGFFLGSEKLESLKMGDDDYRRIARLGSRQAVMEAWSEVERAASEAFMRQSPGMRIFVSEGERFEFLHRKNAISEDDYRRAEKLREFRNKIAQELDISGISCEVIDTYVALALELARKLRDVNGVKP